uniref:Putative potassium channel toxin n=1 Tax=Tityus obscurus TaxID=1221240 RepID=A0A1E1WVQ0_TITOB
MKAFYGILMIFVLCSICYISVDSQTHSDIICNTTRQCRTPCFIKHNRTASKCQNGKCTCYG